MIHVMQCESLCIKCQTQKTTVLHGADAVIFGRKKGAANLAPRISISLVYLGPAAQTPLLMVNQENAISQQVFIVTVADNLVPDRTHIAAMSRQSRKQ